MGSVADGYDAMRVVGRSPDRSVFLTVTGRGELKVELADDVMFTHSEEQLARQVAAAARVALAAFRQEQARIIASTMDEARSEW